MRKIFFYIAAFFSCLSCLAQDHPKYSVSASGHFGFILPHHADMRYLINSHVLGGEINFFKPPKKSSDENKCIFQVPERGLGVLFFDLGNPEQMGSGIAFSPYFNFKINRSEKFNLMLRVGSGIGYVTKPFDRLSNHKDNVIGSHINGFMNMRLNTYFNFSDIFRMDAGIGIAHFSNGAIKLPNLGINIVTVNLGFAIGFGEAHVSSAVDSSRSFIQTKYTITYFNAGVKEVNTPGGKKYPCFNLSINREKRFSQRGKYLYGIEITYNGGNYADFIYYDSLKISKWKNIQAGLKAGYSVVVGKLSIPMEMGVYLYSYEKDNGPIFHRIGLRYQVNKHWHACYTLKTHWAKADFFEFGLGYQFSARERISQPVW